MSRIVVRAANARPLLDTREALEIEFYDDFGDLGAVFSPVFKPGVWSLTTAADKDWPSVLAARKLKT